MKAICLAALMALSASAFAAGDVKIKGQGTVIKSVSEYDVVMCRTIDGVKCMAQLFGRGEISPLEFAKAAGYTKIHRRYVAFNNDEEYIVMEVE